MHDGFAIGERKEFSEDYGLQIAPYSDLHEVFVGGKMCSGEARSSKVGQSQESVGF